MSVFTELKRRNVIRVCTAYIVFAWLIIQVAETVMPAFGFSDAALRLVIIVLAVGLVPAAVFAWAFELTPEGLKKESEVDRSRSVTGRTAKQLDRLIMVTLALGLGYFAVDKFLITPERQSQELELAREQGAAEALTEQREEIGDRSVAVLPFANVGGDEANEVFTDGITEDLLILLGKVPELRTPSRNSVFRFKASDAAIANIAEQLNVRYILDGTVRRHGDAVRVTAQLVNVATDTALWSEAYDRGLEDIFAVQDEIAASVVRELKVKLLDAPPTTTRTDPEVYALFLQARHLNRRATSENTEEAGRLLAQAVALDPSYAPAYEQLAMTYFNKVRRGLLTPEEGYPLARQMAEQALEIDPTVAMAYARLGVLALVDGAPDYSLAASHFRSALELDPDDVRILGNSTFLLDSLHRTEEFVAVTEYIISRDPMDHVAHYNLSLALFDLQRFGDVIRHMEVVQRLSPGMPIANYYRGMALLFSGDAPAARKLIAEEDQALHRHLGLAAVDCALGWDEQARASLAALEEHAASEPQQVAAAFAACGDVDRAFALLQDDIERGGFVIHRFAQDPRYENLRADPRWPALLEAYQENHPAHADVAFSPSQYF